MDSVSRISRINILTAIRDHDLHGAGPFSEALGFDGPPEDVLVERGRRYDARALLSYAHGKATGDILTPEQVRLGDLKVLTDHGFKVVSRAELERPAPAKTTRPRARASSAAPASRTRPEPVVRLCPTCFTQLSVTGICDFCA